VSDQQECKPDFEVTLLEKHGGALTKRLSLDDDGSLITDSAQCRMYKGEASRLRFNSLEGFAKMLTKLSPNQAITLGRLLADLPDTVRIATKKALANGTSDAYPRSKETIYYRAGEPALLLLDVDAKALPADVAQRLEAKGSYWNAICEAVPAFAGMARVERASTRSGLFHGAEFYDVPGSNGLHIYVPVTDGSHIERATKLLHDRLFLAGYGWFEVGKAGQLLERSLIDRCVFSPERIVFEGAPVLIGDLAQNESERVPAVYKGGVLDCTSTFQPLSQSEVARLEAAKKTARQRVMLKAREVAGEVDRREAERIQKVRGVGAETAMRLAQRMREGILLPHVRLEFDDPGLDQVTVGDILANPSEYVGETLADPIEGVDYGPDKAIVLQRADGSLYISSFAHGGWIYQLRYDFVGLRQLINEAEQDGLVDYFLAKFRFSDLAEDELTTLVELVAHRSEAKGSDIRRRLKKVSKSNASETPTSSPVGRIQLPMPDYQGELTPVLETVDEILASVDGPSPPMRDAYGAIVEVRDQRVVGLPDLFPVQSATAASLGTPMEPTLQVLDRSAVCLQIERYIEFKSSGASGSGRLPDPFVAAFQTYLQSRLPVVRAIIVAPLVGPSRRVLTGRGLDRGLEVYFRIDPQLIKLVPPAGSVTEADAQEAYRFLADTWLVDVATGDIGKAVAIAFALSLIQRPLLPERPAFFFTAGQRGGGKTTLLSMLVQGVLGRRPSVSPWPNEVGERRKTILAKLREGYAAIVWDNIETGAEISCPVIEATLTSPTYSDRVLGVSETAEVPATAIQAFTGNNIRPTGDLASRSLVLRLNVDRPDPENRSFSHVDPLGWTACHREEILNALYKLLIYNPYQAAPTEQRPQPKTRFKNWWSLVGAAVEAAAALNGVKVDFGALFSANETSDEAVGAMGRLLGQLEAQFGSRHFTSAEIAALADSTVDDDQDGDLDDAAGSDPKARYRTIIEDLAAATHSEWKRGEITTHLIGKKLQMVHDRPADVDGRVVFLRCRPDKSRGNRYRIEGV
jgi:hypothetical protein